MLLPSGVWASRSCLRGLVTRAIWARRSRPCAPVTRAVCPASLLPPQLAFALRPRPLSGATSSPAFAVP